MEASLSAKTDGRIGDSRFLSVLTESLLIRYGWLLQAALTTKGKVWPMVPARLSSRYREPYSESLFSPKFSTRKPAGVQPELWHRLDT